VEIGKHTADAMKFTTRLEVTELTGSETFVHLDHHGEKWVGLVHGVHNLSLGADLDVYLDPSHVYIFGENGQLVAPAAYAVAA
jgi:glycerol transport system ATP-binding protein